MTELTQKRCLPCEGGVAPMTEQEIQKLLNKIVGWQVVDNKELIKGFKFDNYYETMAFVNAIAWISHQENHHPDLEVSYNHCTVHYMTHAMKGLSENDFICAAKIDLLMTQKK